MKKLSLCLLGCWSLLSAYGVAQAAQWSVTRGAGQQAVAFDTDLPIYRTEYRWEPRQQYVCVWWDRYGHCLAWQWQTYYERVEYEVYDHQQRSHISAQFPGNAVLSGVQSETVTLEYFHNAGAFNRYDAFKIKVASNFHRYDSLIYRFDHWTMPQAYAFTLTLSGTQTTPPEPTEPKPEAELAALINQNMSFHLENRAGKGVLEASVNPAFIQGRVVTQLEYEVVKFLGGSTMPFVVVKGKKEMAELASGQLTLPLYQELRADTMYELRLRAYNNLNKPGYEWSAPLRIGLALTETPSAQALPAPLLKLPKAVPTVALPF